jgi:hypothetical protein
MIGVSESNSQRECRLEEPKVFVGSVYFTETNRFIKSL